MLLSFYLVCGCFTAYGITTACMRKERNGFESNITDKNANTHSHSHASLCIFFSGIKEHAKSR